MRHPVSAGCHERLGLIGYGPTGSGGTGRKHVGGREDVRRAASRAWRGLVAAALRDSRVGTASTYASWRGRVGVDQGSPPVNGSGSSPRQRFRRPGCYAYQIDGTSFGKIIVVVVSCENLPSLRATKRAAASATGAAVNLELTRCPRVVGQFVCENRPFARELQ